MDLLLKLKLQYLSKKQNDSAKRERALVKQSIQKIVKQQTLPSYSQLIIQKLETILEDSNYRGIIDHIGASVRSHVDTTSIERTYKALPDPKKQISLKKVSLFEEPDLLQARLVRNWKVLNPPKDSKLSTFSSGWMSKYG